MTKIGFVDYYLSEWHANNYPAWIANVCRNRGVEFKLCYAWAEQEISPVDGLSTAEWCGKFGVEACKTLEELCEKSDVIVVLAPSDPDRHLPYAKTVLKYGKRTYIDKTFAPDLATAKEIFALAKAGNAPFFSTSALRYATELDKYTDCRQMVTTGGGSSPEEYMIHQIEMVVKKLGIGAESVRAEAMGEQWLYRVKYSDDREAMMLYAPHSMPFTVYMTGGEQKAVWKKADSDYFSLLIDDMVRFFVEGTLSFPNDQTLEVMKIRDGVLRSMKTPETWVSL